MRIALLLVLPLAAGCPADPADPTDTDVDTETDSETGATRVALPIPADAEDLDPDPDIVHLKLRAAPHEFTVGDQVIEGYAYNGQVPGPTIRAKLGDRVVVELSNDLADPTTIHWHGLHVPFEMDGVPFKWDPVAPGGNYTYSFTVEQAGSFWYHPHFDTAHQVDLGLYGALIVVDPADPAVDLDIPVMADSWGEDASRTPQEGSEHHGVDGADLQWTLNGALDPVLRAPAGTTARLRFYDASNTGYLNLDGPVSWVAGDQGVLAEQASGRQLLGPGDRRDAVVHLGSAPVTIDHSDYSLNGGIVDEGTPSALLDIQPEGQAEAPGPLSWGFGGAAPSADPGYTDILWVLQGDAGKDAWYINGQRFPDVDIPVLAPGQEVFIEVRNLSPTDHPLHTHGHAFEVLNIDGIAPTERRIEDTLNIPVRSTARLRLVGGLQGWWMVHCHILPHAEGGMMTVLEVRP